ncbi:MAG: TonB-dependent receptor domain-containing protein [Balneolaceae bacterium]
MYSIVLIVSVLVFSADNNLNTSIKGKVTDDFDESLVGATVQLVDTKYASSTGLDGSFRIRNVPDGEYILRVSFIGFKIYEERILINEQEEMVINIKLEPDVRTMNEVYIVGEAVRGSENQARIIERTSATTMNVVSARAIEQSPDITVANVVQRVSGLSIERNSNGDPQFAIVRGMDKRYNYTLVNGIKIPSPDNENRFIPLDIFPASLLERLEVSKGLTPSMEGDAIGGGLNMVMKTAPRQFEVNADLQGGYNQINFNRDFLDFNTSVVNDRSPRDIYGSTFQATPADFSTGNGEVKQITPMPDLLGSLSIGNRFINNKLGVLFAASFQNTHRGTNSVWFESETDRFGNNAPILKDMQERVFSTRQQRSAFHTNIDFALNSNNVFNVYSGFYNLRDDQVRDILETVIDGRNFDPETGSAILSLNTRTRITKQRIYNTTIRADHSINPSFEFNWSASYARATNERPDILEFIRNSELINFEMQPPNVERRNTRRWESNTDEDYTIHASLKMLPELFRGGTITVGGMFRTKDRDNNFNRFTFDPSPALQIQGRDFETFSDVQWILLNPAGSASNELNYKAREDITAGFAEGKFSVLNTEVTAGLRIEHTDQGYTLKNPRIGQTPDSSQVYTDFLPSVSLKHMPNDVMNIRGSYYQAISRPGFFEIVPFTLRNEDFDEEGNPGLQRTQAHNFDLRWEFFPNTSDQILLGGFYKSIRNPIEVALTQSGIRNAIVFRPDNFGTATNWGIEFDVTKFFRHIGLKANYTFTNSSINTSKILRTREDPDDSSSQLIERSVNQDRPLQGQAKHIANFSVLYKNTTSGTDAQISAVYTGERIETVSAFLDNDMWSRPIIQLDLSFEQRLTRNFQFFARINNLLNSPFKVVIKKPVLTDKEIPFQDDPNRNTLIRRDEFFQSYRMGIRFNM